MKSMKKSWKISVSRPAIAAVAFGVLVLGGGVAPAPAQQVDYTGLEALYGEPVTTSAIGKPQTASQAPVAMEIITSEDIRKSGAMDIPQILRRFAGVDVSRSFKHSADVNVRGYNQPLSNRLLVMVNGRQVYQDNFGYTLWENIPILLSEIKQIEVVKGPNSSLFGFNASSGVINIVTFNPLFDDTDILEGTVASEEYTGGGGVLTMKFNENVATRVSVGGEEGDGFSRSKMFLNPSREESLRTWQGNADTVVMLNDRTSLRLEGGFNLYNGDNLIVYHAPKYFDVDSWHGRANLTHDAGEKGVWDFDLYYNASDTSSTEMRFSPVVIPEMENRLIVAKVSGLFSPAPDHTLRLGGEFRHNSLEGAFLGVSSSSEMQMDIWAANGMWDWRINDRVTLTNAARVDAWSTDRSGVPSAVNAKFPIAGVEPDDVEFSFNSGLVYEHSDVDTWKFSVGRGVRIPSLTELAQDINAAIIGLEIYGNPHLSAETNLSFDLGYQRKLPEYNMTVGGDLVYQRLEDVIVPTVRAIGPGNLLADVTHENVGDSSAFIFELYAKGRLLDDRLGWYANYTFTHINDDPDGLPVHLLDFANTQPKHKINVGLDYTYKNWTFSTDGHFVSGVDYTGFTADALGPRFRRHVDAYFLLNASIGYRFWENTTIRLSGFNIAHQHFQRPTFFSPTPISADGGNEIGRAVILTLEHRF